MDNARTNVVIGIAVIAVIVTGVLVWTQFKAEKSSEPGSGGQKPKAEKMLSARPWSELDVGAFSEAEVQIEHLRKQSAVDWSAIRAEYEKTLPIVQALDARRHLTYESDIAEALDKCEKGDRPKVNQQILAKGLQHVATLGLTHELTSLFSRDTTDAGKVVERIEAFADGIRPTFIRRDKDYFAGKKTLETELDGAVIAVRDAVENSKSLFAANRALTSAVHRTYALSVLYEIEQVEAVRNNDVKACEVKRMEAVIFYRVISDEISRRHPNVNKAIVAMLEATPDQMNASILKKHLQQGLPGIELGI
jgi:hypothetical protein